MLCSLEEMVHLFIARLREVLVPEADGAEWLRRLCAHDLVDDVSERLTRIGCRDGNGDHDVRWRQFPHRMDGGAHARAGRESVVDENDCFVGDVRKSATAAIAALAPFELGALERGDALDILRRNSGFADDDVVEHAHSARRDGTHRELLSPRDAEFAHDEHVERHVQPRGNLVADRNAAARQREHDEVATAGEALQLVREPLAGLLAISESSAHVADAPQSACRVGRFYSTSGASDASARIAFKTSFVVRPAHALNGSLPEREQVMLYLRFYEGLTQSEIAKQLGISQMHVSRLLARSLQQLRELAEDG